MRKLPNIKYSIENSYGNVIIYKRFVRFRKENDVTINMYEKNPMRRLSMKSIKSKVLVSLLTLALVMTSVVTPSVSAEAASKKAVKTVTLKVMERK